MPQKIPISANTNSYPTIESEETSRDTFITVSAFNIHSLNTCTNVTQVKERNEVVTVLLSASISSTSFRLQPGKSRYGYTYIQHIFRYIS